MFDISNENATKTIKRLYYYSISFLLYLPQILLDDLFSEKNRYIKTHKIYTMKKLLLFSALFIFAFSCNDRSDDNPLPAYTIEGKWLWSPDPDDRTSANTMYEFVNGIRYTSYADCWPNNCTDEDFNALDISDRIPGKHTYIWNQDTQTISYEDGNSSLVTFECDGGKILFENGGKLWRLSSDCQ